MPLPFPHRVSFHPQNPNTFAHCPLSPSLSFRSLFESLFILMDLPSRSSVIIVGAGVSGTLASPLNHLILTGIAILKNLLMISWMIVLPEGISAAKVLAENGVEDVVILEASDRIGGRMRKEEFGGVSVEIGAGWIVGVGGKESNPIWELANKSGLRTCLTDYSHTFYNIYDRRSVPSLPRTNSLAIWPVLSRRFEPHAGAIQQRYWCLSAN